MSKNVRIYPFV